MEQIRQLLAACEDGDVATVDMLLKEETTNVNASDQQGTTALQVASVYGYEQLVRFLLMKGAALDQSNHMGWSPLLLAARQGHNNVVSLLLQNNADINSKTKYGANALMLAARGGHLQTCKLLIEDDIDAMPLAGISSATCEFSALQGAAMYGHDAVLRYLIDRGIDVNYRTPSTGLNSLMLAALNGHMATAQILIERGANPNLTNCNNCTPLQIAALSKKREVKGYLDRKTTNKPEEASEKSKGNIFQAVKKGSLVRVKDILDRDRSQCDLVSSQDGATPLMYAAIAGRLDIVQLLMEKGCDVNKQDPSSGWTALMQAVYHGKKNVAKFLVNSGADVLIPAKNGCTAFDLASLLDEVDTELYRLLASKAAQIQPSQATNERPGSKGGLSRTAAVSTPALNQTSETEQSKEPAQRNGIRGWWNRMSNRFRNLKLTGTLRSSNRLAPLPTPSDDPVLEEGKKKPAERMKKSKSSSSTTMTSYETLLLETRKTASTYALDSHQVAAAAQANHNSINATLREKTLKAMIPPLQLPPAFEKKRPEMPPSSHRASNSARNSQLHSRHFSGSSSVSTQNLTSVGGSEIRPRTSLGTGGRKDISPSSSGGASELTGTSQQTGQSKGPSSASSSTLTAGSGSRYIMVYPAHPAQSVIPPARPPSFLQNHQPMSKRPGLLVRQQEGSSVSHHSTTSHHSTANSHSSKESHSTLTPSPAPSVKASKKSASGSVGPKSAVSLSTTSAVTINGVHMNQVNGEDDDLGKVLKNLSLEKYKPIFEEQEVDMEAFLTLSDQDLKEIGVTQAEPRRQILQAINQLSTNKDQERQRYRDSMPHVTLQNNNHLLKVPSSSSVASSKGRHA